MSPLKILVTGSSGPIGVALLASLRDRGYEVLRLVRGSASGRDQVRWDPAQPLSPDAVSGFHAVFHLAGETIAGRWTAAKKQRILTSRIEGTRHLSEALAKAPAPPRLLVSASAVGYYGHRGDEVLREDSSSGTLFLSEVCRQWEAAAAPAARAGIRVAHPRFGVVLSADGGALPKMLTPFRMGLGGKIGHGRQWWSWIAADDVAGALLHILDTERLQGPLNVVSPNPATNAAFTKALARVLRRPAVFPMPAFAARLALGEMADELLLASQRVEPGKLIETGYKFRYPDLEEALRYVLRR
jgi:uncharacterized protein